jgi:hypothetical protein
MKSPEQIEIENKVEELICVMKKLDLLGEQYNYLIAAFGGSRFFFCGVSESYQLRLFQCNEIQR